jgi:hypothetical protein
MPSLARLTILVAAASNHTLFSQWFPWSKKEVLPGDIHGANEDCVLERPSMSCAYNHLCANPVIRDLFALT